MKRLRDLCIAFWVLEYSDLFTLARARLARWIAPRAKPAATIAEVLEAAGYRELTLVPQPAGEIPVVPRPARNVALPSAAELDRFRGVMKLQGAPEIKICRGSDKGCAGCEDLTRCEDCYVVRWHDTRTGGEILEAIKRGDA